MRLDRTIERKVAADDHEQQERCTTLIALTSLHSVRKTSLALIRQREIARELGIAQSTVNRIVRLDLRLKCFKKHRARELRKANKPARLKRARALLRRYPASLVNFVVFTDEKIFTVARPSNTQNDRVYATYGTLKKQVPANRLLRTRPSFSQSVMVSVGVSALGRTSIHFVEPGVK